MNEDGIPEDLASDVEAAFVAVIAAARASAAAAIRERASTLVASSAVGQPDTVFDLEEWIEQAGATVGPALERVLIDAANRAGIGVSLDLADPRMSAAAVRHVEGIAAWGQNFRRTVAKVIEDGMAKGWSVDQMADRLMETGSLTETSARAIARTEAIAAANAGTYEGWKIVGFVAGKTWLATPDERTRQTHVAADGQTVGLDDLFTIGNGTARYPGDPDLPVEERINCRCRMLSVEAEEVDTPEPEPPATTIADRGAVPRAEEVPIPEPPTVEDLSGWDTDLAPAVVEPLKDETWQFSTDPDEHANFMWLDPRARPLILDAQANLIAGRAPDHGLDLGDLWDAASFVGGRFWQARDAARDHVTAAAGNLLGRLDVAGTRVNRRLFTPVDDLDPQRLLVGTILPLFSPLAWFPDMHAVAGGMWLALTPPVEDAIEIEDTYLWGGVVQVTKIDQDQFLVEGRPLTRTGALVSSAAKARLYAEFANPYHDERGRFARKGEGRRVPTKGVEDHDDLRTPDPNQGSLFDAPSPEPETEAPAAVGTIREMSVSAPWPEGTDPGAVHPMFEAHTRYIYTSPDGTEVAVGVARDSDWDPDSPEVEAWCESLARLQTPGVGIMFSDREHPGGVAGAAPNWITIGSPRVASQESFDAALRRSPDWFMPAAHDTDIYTYIVAHEMGHVLTHRNPGIEAAVSDVAAYMMQLAPSIGSHRLNLRAAGLSDYGMSNPMEAIAEAAAQATLDPSGMTRELQAILDLAEVHPRPIGDDR